MIFKFLFVFLALIIAVVGYNFLLLEEEGKNGQTQTEQSAQPFQQTVPSEEKEGNSKEKMTADISNKKNSEEGDSTAVVKEYEGEYEEEGEEEEEEKEEFLDDAENEPFPSD